MKSPRLTRVFCVGTFCLLPVAALSQIPVAPATHLEQSQVVVEEISKAMDSMATALEKTKDKKSAQIAAGTIFSATEKLQKLAKSGRELKDKLTENDKKTLEKTVEKLDMAQYQKRFAKAFQSLADKPEIVEILRPAVAAFGVAAITMAAESNAPPPIRARDKRPLVE